jgi:hypothetical protein
VRFCISGEIILILDDFLRHRIFETSENCDVIFVGKPNVCTDTSEPPLKKEKPT